MAVALKSAAKSRLFFDCFGPPRKQSRNSPGRNNAKQLKNRLKQCRNSHRNSHRNSRNNSLREGETVSPPRAHPLSTRTEQPLPPSPSGYGYGQFRAGHLILTHGDTQ
jgi:hypothetical protein